MECFFSDGQSHNFILCNKQLKCFPGLITDRSIIQKFISSVCATTKVFKKRDYKKKNNCWERHHGVTFYLLKDITLIRTI